MPNEMTLRQAAAYDYNGGKGKPVLGWTVICKERHEKQISRSANIRNGAGKSGKRVVKD